MCGARRVAAVAGASCVTSVLAVPVFAQSDIAMRASVAVERTSVAPREYVPAELVGGGTPPANLLVPRIHRPVIESMLRKSATFRRQCLRIQNAPHLTVTLELASTHASRTARARTQIVRHSADRLLATIRLNQLEDVVELIAHEIEHVIEQLDGVDLAAKAALPNSGVHALDNEGVVFETARARWTGLKVAEEVRRPRQAGGWLAW